MRLIPVQGAKIPHAMLHGPQSVKIIMLFRTTVIGQQYGFFQRWKIENKLLFLGNRLFPTISIQGYSFSFIIVHSYNFLLSIMCACQVTSVEPDSSWVHEPARLLCPWNSLGKNTGVGCCALLQGIFPTWGSNLGLLWLLHCRQILYCWATRGAPYCPS